MTAAVCGTGSAATFANTGEASEPAQRLKRRSGRVAGCFRLSPPPVKVTSAACFYVSIFRGKKDPLEQRDQSSASGPPSNGTEEHLGTA